MTWSIEATPAGLDVSARPAMAPLSRDAGPDLEAADPKFAPDDVSVSDRLVPNGVKEQLRAPTVREASFRTDAPADAPDDAWTWRVELETDDALRRPYTLVFEPVEGRLLSVVRR